MCIFVAVNPEEDALNPATLPLLLLLIIRLPHRPMLLPAKTNTMQLFSFRPCLSKTVYTPVSYAFSFIPPEVLIPVEREREREREHISIREGKKEESDLLKIYTLHKDLFDRPDQM